MMWAVKSLNIFNVILFVIYVFWVTYFIGSEKKPMISPDFFSCGGNINCILFVR